MNMEPIQITCSDDTSLAGHYFTPQQPADFLPVVIAPATGIKQQFYFDFATWLSSQGFHVITFDFRGIGQSLHGALKDCPAAITDWGLYDLPSVVDWALQRCEVEQVNLIGHSAGGQLLGIMPNFDKVAQLTAVAGSTGHLWGLKGKTRILGPLMFYGLFPVSSLLKGYAATKTIGMGENLPKKVAAQWRHFCSYPGYVINAVGKDVQQDFHTAIQCPITAIHAVDDEITSATNVRDLLRLYSNAPREMITLHPAQHGKKSIGHMLMFKEKYRDLWPILSQKCQ